MRRKRVRALQCTLRAVVAQVNAWVELLIDNARVRRQVGEPA